MILSKKNDLHNKVSQIVSCCQKILFGTLYNICIYVLWQAMVGRSFESNGLLPFFCGSRAQQKSVPEITSSRHKNLHDLRKKQTPGRLFISCECFVFGAIENGMIATCLCLRSLAKHMQIQDVEKSRNPAEE